MQLIKKYLPFIVIAFYFVLQIPFLRCDPDTVVDINTRGVWTDEGLYASQVKNLVNHGHFDMKENSTFVRGPVFNIIQLPLFFVFGTRLETGRLATLLFTLIVLCIFLKDKRFRLFGMFLALFTLLEFHIFQFAHYSMAEMICIDCIMFSLFFFIKAMGCNQERKKVKMIFLSSLFLFLCYATKIQFLYAAAILPCTAFIISLGNADLTTFKKLSNLAMVIKGKKISVKNFSLFLYSLGFTIFFVMLYYLLWYLPNKEFYNYIMTSEAVGRYHETFESIRQDALFNYEHVFWVKELKVFITHFYIIIGLALLFFLIIKKKTIHGAIALFAFVWLIIELHKVPGIYIPNRYLISMFFAVGVFVSAFYAALTVHFHKYRFVFFSIALVFGLYNLTYYAGAFQRRSHQLQGVNEYLSAYDLKDHPVIGPWASAVCWKNKALTIPVWNKYFNWENPLNTYKPAIVITESDEKESDETYKSQGIDLKALSDSSRVFDVWNYKFVVYWIKPVVANELLK